MVIPAKAVCAYMFEREKVEGGQVKPDYLRMTALLFSSNLIFLTWVYPCIITKLHYNVPWFAGTLLNVFEILLTLMLKRLMVTLIS